METITGAFEFPDSFDKDLLETASRMIEEGLNQLEIPGSEGMVLVKVGSPEEEKRRGSQIPIAPFEKDGEIFIVCSK